MGLDPITSSAIAATVSNETGNDPSLPLAATAGPYAGAAQSAASGNIGQAAQQGAQTAATQAATAGTGGGAGAAIWPALISGGSDLLGTVLNHNLNKPARPGPIVKNPAYDALMSRYLGIMDDYMQKKGIKPFVAAPAAGAGADAPVTAAVPPTPAPPVLPPPAPVSAVQSQGLDNKLTDASLAASLGARRLGIKTDVAPQPTTRTAFEQDQGQKQQQLNDVYDYIYSQRKLGV